MFKKLLLISMLMTLIICDYTNYQKVWYSETLTNSDCLGEAQCHKIFVQLSADKDTSPPSSYLYADFRTISHVTDSTTESESSGYLVNGNQSNLRFKYFLSTAVTGVHPLHFVVFDFDDITCVDSVLTFSYKIILKTCSEELSSLETALTGENYFIGGADLIHTNLNDSNPFPADTNMLNAFKGVVENVSSICPAILP